MSFLEKTTSYHSALQMSSTSYCETVQLEIFHSLTMAWTQCTVPAPTHTKSPGFWMKRYTGTSSSYRSSSMGHQEPVR